MTLRQFLDAGRTGDMRPFGLKHADAAARFADLAIDLGQLHLGHAGMLGDMVERQDRKTHQRDAEEIEHPDHVRLP